MARWEWKMGLLYRFCRERSTIRRRYVLMDGCRYISSRCNWGPAAPDLRLGESIPYQRMDDLMCSCSLIANAGFKRSPECMLVVAGALEWE